ncbi:hypothetical protein D3C80_2018470 [compost metagenome]
MRRDHHKRARVLCHLEEHFTTQQFNSPLTCVEVHVHSRAAVQMDLTAIVESAIEPITS